MSAQITKRVERWEQPKHPPHVALDQRTRTKVLVQYDGSGPAEAALDSLNRAGLPTEVDVLVAVTNVWLPLSPDDINRAVSARRMKVLTAGMSSFVPALKDYEEQRVLSLEAEARVRAMFPSANINAEGLQDVAAVAGEIVRKAQTWGADLIVIGSNSSPSPHITDYAAPALKVAQDANCSVRIVRVADRTDKSPVRILIGVQEVRSGAAVAQAVAARRWPAGSEATIVLVKSGPRDVTNDDEVARLLAEPLRASGLKVSTVVRNGQAHEVVLQEARASSVDCIFIDAHDGDDRAGLGKAARAIVLGAPCSVEVVRAKTLNDPEFKPAA